MSAEKSVDPKPEDPAAGAPSSETSEAKATTGGQKVDLETLTDGPDHATSPEAAAVAAAALGITDDEPVAPGGAAPAGDPWTRIAALESLLEMKDEELAAATDKTMRAAADLQNLRRRTDRELEDAKTFGGVKLARDLLAVFDNLDMALQHASDELKEREKEFFNGVALTRKELLNAFAKHKIEMISPEAGERFDPNRHQAMFEAPAPGAEPGTVIQVMQAGFVIADRLLRPAMVGVAKKADASAETETTTAETGAA